MVKRVFQFVIFSLMVLLSYPLSAENNQFNVKYAISGQRMSDQVTEFTVWQRQLITIEINITTEHEFAYLKFDENVNNNFKLEFFERPVTEDSPHMFTRRALLYIWPLSSGSAMYSAGQIKLTLSGRVINKFNLDAIKLNVKLLPEYLPPGFPVGYINVTPASSRFIPLFYTKSYFNDYIFTINSTDIHPSFLPDYSSKLLSDQIDTSPPVYEDQVDASSINYHNRRIIRLPAVVNSTSVSRFEKLKISYFDPVESKIVSYYFKSPVIITLGRVYQLILLVFSIYLLVKLSRTLSKMYQQLLYKRQLWVKIIRSKTSRELRNTLLKLTPDSENCLNLSDWAELWRLEDLSASINALNAAIYQPVAGNGEMHDLETIKYNITSTLEREIALIYRFFNSK